MSKLRVQCPAGEERHPVLSRNELDIECRIQGDLRPARTGENQEPVICCADYAKCRVWQTHIEIERFGPSQKVQRDQTLRRTRDTLAG